MRSWIVPTLLMTALTFVSGRAGWKAGIPAEWLFSIWPPAGVAFVGVWRCGWKAVPGCILGISGAIAILAHHRIPEFSAANILASSLLIGMAATLQAGFGVALYRWVAESDPGIIQPRVIFRFLIVVGPLQATVTGLIGPLVRVLFGHYEFVRLPVEFFDWWLNEITGGVAFACIGLPLFSEPGTAWWARRWTVAVPVFLTVIVLSALDKTAPQELIDLPDLERRWLEFAGVLGFMMFVMMLLLITGQAAAVRDEANRLTEELVAEVNERVFAEISLAASQARLAEAQQMAHIGSWVWDTDGFIADWSDEMFRILGYEPKAFVPTFEAFLNCVHPDDRALVQMKMNAAVAGDSYKYDFRIVRPDGAVRILHADAVIDRDETGKPLRWRGTDQDVTERVQQEEERRRLDDRLRTTQRWESLGQLAGGIAHDFNNLMAGVQGYATLAREQLPSDAPVQDLLKPIEDATRHAASLCQQLLTFAGKGISARGAIEIPGLLKEMADLIRLGVPRSVDIEYESPPELPLIEGDRSQLKQVLLNLIWNAADAIATAQRLQGSIIIRTGVGNHEGCHSHAKGHYCSTVVAEACIWLEVSDTGCGIAEDVLPRIFEPFFTTKAVGQGLGLSAVAGIVRSHGGVTCVTSTVGVGTTIRIYLPMIVTELEPPPRDHESGSRLQKSLGQGPPEGQCLS